MGILMDWFLCALVVCAATGTITAVHGRYQLKIARELKGCTEIPPSDDAVESAKRIGSALCERMYVLGFDALIKPGKYGMLSTFGFGKCHELINLIRMAHACGFEFVMRVRSDHDIEKDPQKTEEVLTSINPKWYAGL